MPDPDVAGKSHLGKYFSLLSVTDRPFDVSYN